MQQTYIRLARDNLLEASSVIATRHVSESLAIQFVPDSYLSLCNYRYSCIIMYNAFNFMSILHLIIIVERSASQRFR